jgi:hypothetical protein
MLSRAVPSDEGRGRIPKLEKGQKAKAAAEKRRADDFLKLPHSVL